MRSRTSRSAASRSARTPTSSARSRWSSARRPITNQSLGALDEKRAGAIVAACTEIASGALDSEFVVDVIQGGAGTSTNMNANEVIANRALEILGHGKGEYQHLHPNNDVNMSQSTNDVYPTAIRIGVCFAIERLLEAMAELRRSFEAKSKEFADVLKMGRTQLQDAVPMTLGQEFSTFAVMIGEDEQRLREAAALMHEINLGATAIGTGINTDPRYAGLVTRNLAALDRHSGRAGGQPRRGDAGHRGVRPALREC